MNSNGSLFFTFHKLEPKKIWEKGEFNFFNSMYQLAGRKPIIRNGTSISTADPAGDSLKGREPGGHWNPAAETKLTKTAASSLSCPTASIRLITTDAGWKRVRSDKKKEI